MSYGFDTGGVDLTKAVLIALHGALSLLAELGLITDDQRIVLDEVHEALDKRGT